MSTSNKLADGLLDIIGENAKALGVQQWLDTGIPELNWALSNNHKRGLPVGRMVEVFGPSSSGKTFLATMAMSAAQKAGGIVGFSDHERTFDPVIARTLGLNTEGLGAGFVYRRPKTFEDSVEEAVSIAEKVREKGLIAEDAPMVWVFDSVASMVPYSKLYDDKGNRREAGSYNMKDKLALATSTSQSYPVLAQFAEDNNMLVLLLNQVRTKPGVLYGNPETTPGGNAAEYYASVRLSLGRKEITNDKKGKDKIVEGFEVTAKTVKNKCARFGRQASWKVMFNEGLGVTIDQIATNVDYLKRIGLIEEASKGYLMWGGKKLRQSEIIKRLREDDNGNEQLMELMPDGED